MMKTALDSGPPGRRTPLRQSDNTNDPSGVVEVCVDNAAELDDALNDAVALVLEAATEYRTGVMVTRVDVGKYVVQADRDVPAGLIRQRHARSPMDAKG